MIIQVRGTSGSGKSTVMRQVMDQLGPFRPVMSNGRKQPLYYLSGNIVVLGHYESPCGGCDTIGSARAVYGLITNLLNATSTRVILCEGLLLSEDTKWSLQLPELRVLFLTTPVEECLERIKARRLEAGNDKELNPNNTVNRVAVIERARVKLVEAGIYCRRGTSDQAPAIVQAWIQRAFGQSRGQ